jgi:signal transduction histidine kinase
VKDSIHLSELLAARRTQILARWTQRIGREHAEKDLTGGELADDLPPFFDAILTALRAQEENGNLDTPATDRYAASRAHGAQRLQAGFDLVEVIREYELLTEYILDEVEAVGGKVSIAAFRRLQRLLNAGRAAAVAAYVSRRDVDLARTHTQHVAFIAHELRNPLMTAFMAVTVLQKNARSEDDWALSVLVRNLSTLRDLIDEVLVNDRLQGQVQLNYESVDLRVLLEEAISAARLTAAPRQIELVLQASDSLPFSGDARLLRSAIGNVLGNAIKFTHDAEAVTVRTLHRDGAIVIEIEDRCGGLPDGNPEDLFRPFVQRSENRSGFGLGLAIVKQAIEAHQGHVRVHNRPGQGCVFCLELPQGTPGSRP